jgi:hypothetical protein
VRSRGQNESKRLSKGKPFDSRFLLCHYSIIFTKMQGFLRKFYILSTFHFASGKV